PGLKATAELRNCRTAELKANHRPKGNCRTAELPNCRIEKRTTKDTKGTQRKTQGSRGRCSKPRLNRVAFTIPQFPNSAVPQFGSSSTRSVELRPARCARRSMT